MTREHNVDFTIRNSQADSFIPQTEGTKKLLKVQLQTQLGLVTIFSAYPPTLISIQEAKDKFYDEFSAAINEVPFQEPLLILSDFNTRVGSDHHSWPACLGQFRTGKMSVKGQHLLKLCCQQNLYITNTFFNTKPQHKVSWRHPRSNYWHQLDLIITAYTTSRQHTPTKVQTMTPIIPLYAARWNDCTIPKRKEDHALMSAIPMTLQR